MSWFARREILVISLLVAAGVELRIAWVMAGGHLAPVISELYNISGRFAIDGVLGEAFRPGQGPTAHSMPLRPDRKSTRENSSHQCAHRIPSPTLKKKQTTQH